MTQSEHTPGPWKMIPSPHGRDYRCVQLGKDDTYTTLEMLPADARLIAAAPDLLAACKRAKKLLEPEVEKEPDRTIFWELVAAIRKATGAQP